MEKRIDNLTGLRAFAATWVVVFHLTTSSAVKMNLGAFLGHGYFGVDIFFVLSGMILSFAYADQLPRCFSQRWYRRFLFRRFAKIYPMHLITFILMAILVLAGKNWHYRFVSGAENTLWSALCNVLLIHSFGLTHANSWNFPSWSVSAEWFAYSFLFAPMVFILRRWRMLFVAALAAILWVTFLCVCNRVLHASFDLTYKGAIRIVPEFLCGYLLYRVLTEKHVSFSGDVWALSGLTLLVVISRRADLNLLLMPAVMLLLGGAYRGGPAVNRFFGNRPAVLIGEASYSIYMIQAFAIDALNQIVRRFHLISYPPALPFLLLFEIVAIAIFGWLAFTFVEEPMRLSQDYGDRCQKFRKVQRNPLFGSGHSGIRRCRLIAPKSRSHIIYGSALRLVAHL